MSKRKRLTQQEIEEELKATLPLIQGSSHDYVLAEYEAILEDMAMMNGRRQNTNQLFVGINSVFLTALGFLLASSHLTSWWPSIELAAITLAILPLNILWLRTMSVYANTVRIRHETLQRIEEHSQLVGKVYFQYRQFTQTPIVRVERYIAYYFLVIYFLLALGVAILTYLILHGVVSAPQLS